MKKDTRRAPKRASRAAGKTTVITNEITAAAGNNAARSSPPRQQRKSARTANRSVETRNTERRDAIAAAALKLFSKFGFVAVSNQEIGEMAGINPALIYYYFENRDDLFQFVVRKALADALSVYERLRHRHAAIGGLEAWLSSNLLLSEEISNFLKIVLDYAHSERQSPLTDDAIARFYNTEVEILASAIHREIGVAQPRATDLARLVSVFLDGVMVARVVRPEIDLERIVNVMREVLRPERG
jgi:AcrR family transcriptional regulator